jgi:hypothetical protein
MNSYTLLADRVPTAGRFPPRYFMAFAPVPDTFRVRDATAAVLVTVNLTNTWIPVVSVNPLIVTALAAVAAAVAQVA